MESGQPRTMTSPVYNSNPRQLIESLIASISPPSGTTTSTSASQGSNPIKFLPQSSKNIFLTLYALFETSLLPALDCLDRGLVTHLILPKNHPAINNNSSIESSSKQDLYLVRSAQQHHTRNGAAQNINYYEVRLEAWNCSCPAFSFAAFPAPLSNSHSNFNDIVKQEDIPPKRPRLFGGLTRGMELPPVCKHILACTLVRDCKGFDAFVEEREVSREELAGWAAGWGD